MTGCAYFSWFCPSCMFQNGCETRRVYLYRKFWMLDEAPPYTYNPDEPYSIRFWMHPGSTDDLQQAGSSWLGAALRSEYYAQLQQCDLRNVAQDGPDAAVVHDQGWDQAFWLITPVSDQPFVVPDWQKRRRRCRAILGVILAALVVARLALLAL